MKNSLMIKSISIFILTSILLIITTINQFDSAQLDIKLEKCYLPPNDTNLRIIHIILTRFMIEYWPFDGFSEKIYKEEYILNGIRVMKKYLFDSLENQSCKQFIWVLMLGDNANITKIKNMFDFNLSFDSKIIYKKDIKSFLKNISKGFDILITTRIDYDDRIYYDAVNDVRKAININKPMIIYGYNSGVHYYEFNNNYYEFNLTYNNEGVMSIFISLIVVLNKVNDVYSIHDLGTHIRVRQKLLESYKSFGINELNYEPAIFDSGEAKFVWVRQKYSGLYNFSINFEKNLKLYNFNLSKFYGK